MKRFLQIWVGIAAIGLSVSAWSAGPPEGGQGMSGGPGASSGGQGMGGGGGMGGGQGMGGGGHGEHPCKAVEEACKSAGFVKGGAEKGNGIFKDCMKPLMSGQAVKNVSVAPEKLEACKAKMAAREHGGGGMGGGGGGQQQGGGYGGGGGGQQQGGGYGGGGGGQQQGGGGAPEQAPTQ